MPATQMHEAVLSRLRTVILNPKAVEVALRAAEARWEELRQHHVPTSAKVQLVARRTVVESESKRLVEAIANGADLPLVRQALLERQEQLAEVDRTLAALDVAEPLPPLDDALRARLHDRLSEWQCAIDRSPVEGNALLRRILADKISFTPREDDQGPYYEFVGHATFGAVLAGFVPNSVISPEAPTTSWNLVPQNLASPTGFEPVF